MNQKENFYLYLAVSIIVFTALFTFLILSGCASTQHRKADLQARHPECFVETIDEGFEITCPDPFQTMQGTINYFEEKQRKADQ